MARGDAFTLQGMDGGSVLAGGDSWVAPEDGGGRWVSVVEDAVLASYAGNLFNGDLNLTGITLPVGFGFGGITTALSVTSGRVIVYEFGGQGTVS